MSSRTLILGATGLLGSILLEKLRSVSETFGTHFNFPNEYDKSLIHLDATNLSQLRSLVNDIGPSRIINCVGLASVENCEKRPEASWKLNVEIPLSLAKLVKETDIQLVHISTDHFASKNSRPRKESDSVYPVNQYGFSKIYADHMILKLNPRVQVLRTNFFGRSMRDAKSLLDFAVKELTSKDTVKGFQDVWFTPVGALEIGKFLLDERSNSTWGMLNFASANVITKYEFIVMVATYLGYRQSKVEPSSISNSDLLVKRPNYLALNSSRLTNEIGFQIPSIYDMIGSELQFHEATYMKTNG